VENCRQRDTRQKRGNDDPNHAQQYRGMHGISDERDRRGVLDVRWITHGCYKWRAPP